MEWWMWGVLCGVLFIPVLVVGSMVEQEIIKRWGVAASKHAAWFILGIGATVMVMK